MKKTFTFLAIAALALSMGSCNKDEGGETTLPGSFDGKLSGTIVGLEAGTSYTLNADNDGDVISTATVTDSKFSIELPEVEAEELFAVDDNFFSSIMNMPITVTNSNPAIMIAYPDLKLYTDNDDYYDRLALGKCNMQGNETSATVSTSMVFFIYADGAARITGSSSYDMAGDAQAVSIDLNIVKGWNRVNLEANMSTDLQSRKHTITSKLSSKIPGGLNWLPQRYFNINL